MLLLFWGSVIPRYAELCLRLSQSCLGGVDPKRFKTMLLEKCQEVRYMIMYCTVAASQYQAAVPCVLVLLLLYPLCNLVPPLPPLKEFQKDRSAILKAIQVRCTN